MKVIAVSIGSILVTLVCVFIVKFWGQSQRFTEYKHPFLAATEMQKFVKPSFAKLAADIDSEPNLYLDVAITRDQKLVLPKIKFTKPVRNSTLEEIKENVIAVTDLKSTLKNKKIIFNILDSVIAVHEVFADGIKELGLEKGENFLVTSEYEQPVKALKELVPEWLYGSTKPEILKMVAMQSMHVLEAASIRADVIVHPLKIHNQYFFNDEMMLELKRRYKKIILGPLTSEEVPQAELLHPYAIIIQD